MADEDFHTRDDSTTPEQDCPRGQSSSLWVALLSLGGVGWGGAESDESVSSQPLVC